MYVHLYVNQIIHAYSIVRSILVISAFSRSKNVFDTAVDLESFLLNLHTQRDKIWYSEFKKVFIITITITAFFQTFKLKPYNYCNFFLSDIF